MPNPYVQSRVYMDTIVTIEVSSPGADVAACVERGFGWFAEVEQRCSRFDPGSEVTHLCRLVGVDVAVSSLLYEAIEFSLRVAEASKGAFDPTVGGAMLRNGYDQNYRSGERIPAPKVAPVSFRDVVLVPPDCVHLCQPLILDLGAVAKGLAIDLAARELAHLQDFSINAGGDVLLSGLNPVGQPWRIGIRHPRAEDALITSVAVSSAAVCTSGDYERHAAGGAHIVQPATGTPADSLASVTVIAESAMLADAISTAAFVLGPDDGRSFLEAQGVEGLLVTGDLRRLATSGFRRYEA